jgi:hypothetical protein
VWLKSHIFGSYQNPIEQWILWDRDREWQSKLQAEVMFGFGVQNQNSNHYILLLLFGWCPYLGRGPSVAHPNKILTTELKDL